MVYVVLANFSQPYSQGFWLGAAMDGAVMCSTPSLISRCMDLTARSPSIVGTARGKGVHHILKVAGKYVLTLSRSIRPKHISS